MEEKRLFLALQVLAPWPEKLPKGRSLSEENRHCTLAFLGQTDYPTIVKALESFPSPLFHVGFAGCFDKCLFLPERHPHVVAWHIRWLEDAAPLNSFQKHLTNWLQSQQLHPQHADRPFLPHVTLCRSPFDLHDWKKAFTPLPVITTSIHLYESLGHSHYQSLWQYPIALPFEEIDHTADIAFKVRGSTIQAIHQHARIALAFRYPPLLNYFLEAATADNLDDIIIDLNALIGKADQEIGCPFKAVSFHGSVERETDHILTWEMIVDV